MKRIALILVTLLAGSAAAQINLRSALQSDKNEIVTFNGKTLTREQMVEQTRIEPETAAELMSVTRDYLLRHSWAVLLFDTSGFHIKAEFIQINPFNTNRTSAELYFQNLLHVTQYNSIILCMLKFSYFLSKPPRGGYITEAEIIQEFRGRDPLELTETAYASLFDGLENHR